MHSIKLYFTVESINWVWRLGCCIGFLDSWRTRCLHLQVISNDHSLGSITLTSVSSPIICITVTSSWTWRGECLVIQGWELASLAAISDASWWETIMKVDSLNINIEVKSNMLDNRWQHLSIVSIYLFSFRATSIDLWSINCVQFTRVTHVTNSCNTRDTAW